jgi:FkbM family methyltransferase
MNQLFLWIAKNFRHSAIGRSCYRKLCRRQKGNSFKVNLAHDLQMQITSGDSVANQLMVYQIFEPALTKTIESLAGSFSTFIDVGCNIGYFSCLVSRLNPGVQLISVDPNPEMIKACRANLSLNGLSTHYVEKGLGSSPRALPLRYRSGSPSHGSFGGDLHQNPDVVEYACEITTLPILLKEKGLASVDGLKMDIEGFEYEVFSSLPEDLARGFKHIFFEYSEKNLNRCGASRAKLAALTWLQHFDVFFLDETFLTPQKVSSLLEVPPDAETVWLKNKTQTISAPQ